MAGLVNVAARGMAEQVVPHNLLPLEFALLRIFLDREECTTTQLAGMLPVTVSRTSRTVTKLVDRGLLRHRRVRNDRRVVMLALTLELHRRVREFDARLTSSPSEEAIAAFASATHKIIANYAALAHSGPYCDHLPWPVIEFVIRGPIPGPVFVRRIVRVCGVASPRPEQPVPGSHNHCRTVQCLRGREGNFHLVPQDHGKPRRPGELGAAL